MKRCIAGLVTVAVTFAAVAPAHAMSHEFVGEDCRINLTISEIQTLNMWNPLMFSPSEIDKFSARLSEDTDELKHRLELMESNQTEPEVVHEDPNYKTPEQELRERIQLQEQLYEEMEACKSGPVTVNDSGSSSSDDGTVIVGALASLAGVIAGVLITQFPQINQLLRR